jgi:hypothetical protein
VPTILAQVCERLGGDHQQAAFRGYLVPLHLPAGAVLVEQGAASDALDFVEHGSVSIY